MLGMLQDRGEPTFFLVAIKFLLRLSLIYFDETTLLTLEGAGLGSCSFLWHFSRKLSSISTSFWFSMRNDKSDIFIIVSAGAKTPAGSMKNGKWKQYSRNKVANQVVSYNLNGFKSQSTLEQVQYNNKLMKPQAAGSLWNVNSWHWEMKNYVQPAKQILEKNIFDLVFEVAPDVKVRHRKVNFTKAECQINVRKGKQILVYDFELDLTVFGENQTEDDSEGSYKVKEILSDDLNDMIIDDVKSNEKNKTGDLMKKWIKKNAKDKIVGVFKQMEAQLMQNESDPKKLEEDKKKREDNMLATKKAREEKGDEKERLLEEQRAKEKKLKEEAMQKNFEQAIKKPERW